MTFRSPAIKRGEATGGQKITRRAAGAGDEHRLFTVIPDGLQGRSGTQTKSRQRMEPNLGPGSSRSALRPG